MSTFSTQRAPPTWAMDMKDAKTEGVSPEVLSQLQGLIPYISTPGQFGHDLLLKMKLKEAKLEKRQEDGKLHSRVVFSITMGHDMANVAGSLHGGCSAFLIDVCSTMAFWVVGFALSKLPKESGNAAVSTAHVSQAINVLYHAGTHIGAELEIVNTTTSWGKRIVTARTEIWDVTNRRLVSSGTHVKMEPGVKL